MNRETTKDFERFQRFEELLKKPYAAPFIYPDPPKPPPLEGFQNRVLFAIDLCGHFGRYISKPMTQLTLAELLEARRVLVDPAADQSPDTPSQAASKWVSKWCSHNNRTDLFDCLGSIASTTLKAIEEIVERTCDHIYGEFQRKFIVKKEKKDADESSLSVFG